MNDHDTESINGPATPVVIWPDPSPLSNWWATIMAPDRPRPHPKELGRHRTGDAA